MSKLLKKLPNDVGLPERLLNQAKVLDNFYIPTRCPDSYSEGAPFEHYGNLQSEEAVKYASQIIKFVRTNLA